MIFELLRTTAHQHRDELAIVDQHQRITYGDLLERIGGMQGWLRGAADLHAGGVVAASLSNTWQFIASFFAVSELGGVFMPCNPQWRAEELRWFAARIGFRAVITEPQFRAEWDRVGDVVNPGSILTVDSAASHPRSGAGQNSVPLHGRSEDDAAIYLPTSGSTGVPRVVPRTHRNLEAAARNVARALGFGPGRRLLSVVPFFHANGFHNCMLMPLVSGATLVLMQQFSPAACHEYIQREAVDVLIGSPFIYSALADSAADPGLLSSLKFCFSAGARMPGAVSERWRDRCPIPVRQWYGTSETSVISIDRALEEPDSADPSVGTPIPGVEVKVLDADGAEVACGTAGELVVRSQAVMSGYVGEPELNQRIFHNGFFRTGDFGYIDSAGSLYLTGRMRRAINLGGVKVDPLEVEQVVEALAGVSRCQVDTVPNGKGGEMIRARILVRQGFDVTRRDVIVQCRERLAEYKLPRIIEFEETLPAMVAGKMPVKWTGGLDR